MSLPDLEVLFEDNHLLAIVKPAGLPTMGVADDVPSALSLAKEYVRQKHRKPGNVYLGAMSRLDAPVSGVLLFARTSKAAARLTAQFKDREVDKLYWAVVEGRPEPPAGRCVDHLAEDERHRKMRVVGPTMPGAKLASLAYRTLAPLANGCTLLEVTLETGRKHQIRLQLGSRGHPVLGDRKYGGVRKFPAGIALHARRLVVAHPVQADRQIELVAPLPASWRQFDLPR